MRESIGGLWLYGIIMVFMMFMIAYVSASLNYSRAYKVKTQVVNIIEEYQGVSDKTVKKISSIISANGYTTQRRCSEVLPKETKYVGITAKPLDQIQENMKTVAKTGDTGEKPQHVCITRSSYNAPNKKLYTDYYYDVTMFFKFNIPIFGDIFTFSVKGETNSIYYPTDNNNWT